VYGDATLATRDKGERIAAALVDDLVIAAEALRAAQVASPRAGIPWRPA
jgi:creatinine amidohydrolase/Fe(II)-dependent formamide hydrolase-like protein